MKYNSVSVLRAVEVCYSVDLNPCPVSVFIDYFCMKYGLERGQEERSIRRMLQLLAKHGRFEIKDDKIHMWNMLRQNLKMEIIG